MSKSRVISVVFSLNSALMVLTIFGAESRAQAELVINGSFEEGDFTGWTKQSLGSAGDWFVYSGTSIEGFTILPPPDGTFAAVTEQDDPDSNILYQDIAIPEGAEVTCTAIVYLTNQTGEGTYIIGDGLTLNCPNQQMGVDLMDPEADPLDTGAGCC
jgi:hypothetical protein